MILRNIFFTEIINANFFLNRKSGNLTIVNFQKKYLYSIIFEIDDENIKLT